MNLKQLAKEAHKIAMMREIREAYRPSDQITIKKNCARPNCRNNVHLHECPNGTGERFESDLIIKEGSDLDAAWSKGYKIGYQDGKAGRPPKLPFQAETA